MSEKCPEVHISFNISATIADIVLKLTIVLYHHKTIHIPIYITLTCILTKLFPFFTLRKYKKNNLSLNILAANTDIVFKLMTYDGITYLYHHLNNSYTNSHKSDFYFHKIIPLFRHILLNISATTTDIVLKLKMVLLHHKTSLYVYFHNFDIYFEKMISFFRLGKC